MNVEEKTVLEFTQDDVMQILSEYAQSKGYNPTKVTLTLSTVSKGFGMSEHNETVFKGARVECKK